MIIKRSNIFVFQNLRKYAFCFNSLERARDNKLSKYRQMTFYWRERVSLTTVMMRSAIDGPHVPCAY